MKVYLNNLRGIDDALVSLYMSKRSWTREMEMMIRDAVDSVIDCQGFIDPHMISLHTINNRVAKERGGETYDFEKNYEKLLTIGQKHTTLLRYIDFSFTVSGLHRGAQDDLDSHAHRFNNRIIRSSTRLAQFKDYERSTYYSDKIIPLGEFLKMQNITLEDTVTINGVEYVRRDNGYVNKTYIDAHPEESQDVERGLYMLSIPSNCIVKCDLFEFAHVYRMRNKNTHAAPELKDCIEDLVDQLQSALNVENLREYLAGIHN